MAVADAPFDRTRLPVARTVFRGTANRTLAGSVPDRDFFGHVTPPGIAPNFLLVLIDDAGFRNPSTFGGPIATRAMTRVAEEDARFNRFHVTAVLVGGAGSAITEWTWCWDVATAAALWPVSPCPL